MKRDAWKRLEAMEARVKAAKIDRSPEAVFALIMPVLLAARLGGWRDHEAVASAYARAVDLNGRELLAAFEPRNLTDLQARHATAARSLFHAVGIDVDNASADDLVVTTEKMIAELPSRLKGLIGAV